MKTLSFINTSRKAGVFKAGLNLAKELLVDAAFSRAPQANLVKIFLDYAVPMAVDAVQAKMLHDLRAMRPFEPKAPARIVQAEPKPTKAPEAPSDDVKAPAEAAGSILDDLLLPAGLLALGGGAYLLAKGTGTGDCDGLYCVSGCCPVGSTYYLPSTGKCYSGSGDFYWAHFEEAELCAYPVMTLKLRK
jgi:hypothetical protein